MKLLKPALLCVIFLFSICLLAQTSDRPPNVKPGACYAKCLMPASSDETKYSSRFEEYPVYIGDRPEKVKVKNIKIETRPAKKEWVKKKAERNCLSPDPNDCLVWCLVDKEPAEFVELEVLKNTRKLEDHEWEYEQVEIYHKGAKGKGGMTEWREVVCQNKVTTKFINQINEKLIEQGYESGSDGNEMDSRIKSALTKMQRDNGLPVGQLDLETLKFLGVKI